MKSLLILLTFFAMIDSYSDSNKYLENRIPEGSHRHLSFQKCLELMEQRNAKNLIETGTSRDGLANCLGDGCSTVIFAHWAKENGATLTSIDIDPSSILKSMQAVSPINTMVHFAIQDSVSFLHQYDQKIDFLYLDSYDFDANDPLPSQKHHLNEIVAAYPSLTKDSIVMIDDCALPHGGKGLLAIEFLINQGWIVYYSGYQVILIHKDSL